MFSLWISYVWGAWIQRSQTCPSQWWRLGPRRSWRSHEFREISCYLMFHSWEPPLWFDGPWLEYILHKGSRQKNGSSVFWSKNTVFKPSLVGENFHIWARAEWVDPLPPYGRPDCKISGFFVPIPLRFFWRHQQTLQEWTKLPNFHERLVVW